MGKVWASAESRWQMKSQAAIRWRNDVQDSTYFVMCTLYRTLRVGGPAGGVGARLFGGTILLV